jgi:hypothetical protein
MPTTGAHSRGSLFGNVLTGHTAVFTTHINHLYTIPSIAGGILQSREREHIFIVSFGVSILYAYYILFYTVNLFFIHLIFAPPPPIFPP